MQKRVPLETAQACLLAAVVPVLPEETALEDCAGRLLAEDIAAREHIPPFDRSPYDGYAFRAEDVQTAGEDAPVTLRVLESVPAGKVPTMPVTAGTATRIMTGSPIPAGADAVIMYEKTVEGENTVTISMPVQSGSNVVLAGEDVKKGTVIAKKGAIIDAGLAASLAAQGISRPRVYPRLTVGIVSTGSELVEADEAETPGKIRNINRYMLGAALHQAGFRPVYLGKAKDDVSEIQALIEKGLADCDAVVLTGGVSAGDFDLTPDAMQAAGVELLFRGVQLKPGMACAYGLCGEKPVCALSGNPASAMTNFYALALPALRRRAGFQNAGLELFSVKLMHGFPKKSPATRLLRGKLVFKNGEAWMEFPKEQGNVVISSAIGCDMMGIIPAGSGPVEAGELLDGFLL